MKERECPGSGRPPLTPYGEYVRSLEAAVRLLLRTLEEEHDPVDLEPNCPICNTAHAVIEILTKRPFPTDKAATPLEDALQELAIAENALITPSVSTGSSLYWRRQREHLKKLIEDLRGSNG